jgi:hypothetical protein
MTWLRSLCPGKVIRALLGRHRAELAHPRPVPCNGASPGSALNSGSAPRKPIRHAASSRTHVVTTSSFDPVNERFLACVREVAASLQTKQDEATSGPGLTQPRDHRELGHNLGSLENANGAYRGQRCCLRRRKLLYHSAKVAGDHPRIKPIPRFHRLDSLQYLQSLRKPGD